MPSCVGDLDRLLDLEDASVSSHMRSSDFRAGCIGRRFFEATFGFGGWSVVTWFVRPQSVCSAISPRLKIMVHGSKMEDDERFM